MTTTQIKTARHLGLGLTALETILTLAEHGEQTLGDLSIYLGISTAAITGTADALVKKGFAARVHGIADRRTIRLRLTGAGENAHFRITGREAGLKI